MFSLRFKWRTFRSCRFLKSCLKFLFFSLLLAAAILSLTGESLLDFYYKPTQQVQNTELAAPSLKTTSEQVQDEMDGILAEDLDAQTSKGTIIQIEIENIPPQHNYNYTPPWTWECRDDGKCHRVLMNKAHAKFVTSIEVCWLTCGRTGSLWPYPTPKCKLGTELVPISPGSISLERYHGPVAVKDLTKAAFRIMLEEVQKIRPEASGFTEGSETINTASVALTLTVRTGDRIITLLTNESYSLRISTRISAGKKIKVKIDISAVTFFGLRHGFETLSQLMTYDHARNTFQLVSKADIKDAPAFPYRGMLLDTARNFIPLPNIRKLIQAMSYNKLNMFHWHITDSSSFPFFSKSFPQMTDYGAYSASEIYYPKEIAELIEFARVRGVKVIPELDAPAHSGEGWQWGRTENYGDLVLNVDAAYNSNSGKQPSLNPVNPKVYDVLEKLYGEMQSVFEQDLFHMGGDEMNLNNWNTPEINKFIEEQNLNNFMDVWVYFQIQAYKRLEAANNGSGTIPILWASTLTDSAEFREVFSPQDYIIQSWKSSGSHHVELLLKDNFPMIFSTVEKTYLDWGAGSSIGISDNWPYINWQTLYDMNLGEFGSLTKKVKNSKYGNIRQILGAEAPLWAEKVNGESMEAKLWPWPRGAAHAERLWSNPKTVRTGLVYARLLRHNERMRGRGIKTDTRQPKSCILIQSNCDDPKHPL